MNCSSIDIIFPITTTGSIESASSILLNAIPTLVTFTIFISFMITNQPSKYLLPIYFPIFIGIVCIAVVTLLLWRMFELLECDNHLELLQFKYLVIILQPLLSFILLFISYYRNIYRVSTILVIIMAFGFVAIDYSLRRFASESAAQPIFPAQGFVCSLALCCLFVGKYVPLVKKSKSCEDKTINKNSNNSQKGSYCFQPNFLDPTSRHPTESKGVGSAPDLRTVF